MLILSRKRQEAIVIDRKVVVKVIEIVGGGRVRLGIQAPREIPVHRGEVWRAIQEQRYIQGTLRQGAEPEDGGDG